MASVPPSFQEILVALVGKGPHVTCKRCRSLTPRWTAHVFVDSNLICNACRRVWNSLRGEAQLALIKRFYAQGPLTPSDHYGPCAACKRMAPLVDSECPNCRH